MCKKYIHNKAVQVFNHLMENVKSLRESKRKQDEGYRGPLRFMIKGIYGCKGRMCYMIFVIKESDSKYCLAAWEIIAEFDDLNEDFFYFIKSKMLSDNTTKWYCVPLFIENGIECSYDSNEVDKNYSFLNLNDSVVLEN